MKTAFLMPLSNICHNLSLLRRKAVDKTYQLLGRYQRFSTTTSGACWQWFELINIVNRRLLLNSHENVLRGRWLGKRELLDFSWKVAFNTLGAEQAHRQFQNTADLSSLQTFFDRNIDQNGQWLTPIDKVEYVMKGYTLLYLCELLDAPHYKQAAHRLAQTLLESHPRTSDGSLIYDLNTGSVLVDTLGMVGPFLARYARIFKDPDALELSLTQFRQFILRNVDDESKLPYHGYFADGPRHLGLHAWGRGTGWYMMGLVDTLAEIDQDQPDYKLLKNAFIDAATSLQTFQLESGHWNWAILHRIGPSDSSTTSIIGYSLLRGIEIGLLHTSFRTAVERAIHSLPKVTRANGVLDGSLAECRGLGKYPQVYKPTLWLQGSATAFAALYLNKTMSTDQETKL